MKVVYGRNNAATYLLISSLTERFPRKWKDIANFRVFISSYFPMYSLCAYSPDLYMYIFGSTQMNASAIHNNKHKQHGIVLFEYFA